MNKQQIQEMNSLFMELKRHLLPILQKVLASTCRTEEFGGVNITLSLQNGAFHLLRVEENHTFLLHLKGMENAKNNHKVSYK